MSRFFACFGGVVVGLFVEGGALEGEDRAAADVEGVMRRRRGESGEPTSNRMGSRAMLIVELLGV